jgi:hypothetical protein
MPLEVRQIAIQMQVGGGRDRAPDTNVAKIGGPACGGSRTAAEQARLVDQCVEAVLAELARRAER